MNAAGDKPPEGPGAPLDRQSTDELTVILYDSACFQGKYDGHDGELLRFKDVDWKRTHPEPSLWDSRSSLWGSKKESFAASEIAEIGITLAPEHQGAGYATEAVTGLLDYLFTATGKHRVIASVDPRNTACIALLERIGIRREAHFRQSLWFKGEWADDLVFAILRSEWPVRSRSDSR